MAACAARYVLPFAGSFPPCPGPRGVPAGRQRQFWNQSDLRLTLYPQA